MYDLFYILCGDDDNRRIFFHVRFYFLIKMIQEVSRGNIIYSKGCLEQNILLFATLLSQFLQTILLILESYLLPFLR